MLASPVVNRHLHTKLGTDRSRLQSVADGDPAMVETADLLVYIPGSCFKNQGNAHDGRGCGETGGAAAQPSSVARCGLISNSESDAASKLQIIPAAVCASASTS